MKIMRAIVFILIDIDLGYADQYFIFAARKI